ncbi:MAG TPA: fructosamine kinase [Sulfurovum sp.]|nr:fructosamine kinase [Sulfurovum sp.]
MDLVYAQLSDVLDKDILSIDFFMQGQIGDIYKIKTVDKSYILKTSEPSHRLQTEADMLKDINKYGITVPAVYDVSKTQLLMEYIETKKVAKQTRETVAASVLSKLHSVTNESRMYGYYYDTTIGPFQQKNEQTQYNWALFLGQMRIIPIAKICYEKGEISKDILDRIERLCADLYKRIDMSTIKPSLLHGDLWNGNILFNINSMTLIDPAIYYGDKEMELAFILLFNTFGETFFREYTQVHALSVDFYELKVPMYQLYPLLVHVALYGGVYIEQLENRLQRLKV